MILQVVADLPIREATAQDFKVNGWYARKVLGGTNTIIEAVQAWDTSALSIRYKLAKSLLLDEDQAAIELMESRLDEAAFDYGLLKRWPLLEKFRKQGFVDGLLERKFGGIRQASTE
jgi:hypothetical protein